MPDFIIYKEKGLFKNIQKMEEYNKSLPDGRYKVIIEKAGKRSGQQNRYYWSVVIPLVTDGLKDLGHEVTQDETHEFLKAKFNAKEVVNSETGETLNLPLSTTRLTKLEFSEYILDIQRFAAEFLGVNIPDPGQQMAIDDTV